MDQFDDKFAEAYSRWERFVSEKVERIEKYVDEEFRIAKKLTTNVDVIEEALRRVLDFNKREAELSGRVANLEAELKKMKKVLDRAIELSPKDDPVLNWAISEWEKEK